VWKWRRRLLSDILTNIVLQFNIHDRWNWHLHVSEKYNFASTYNYMLSSLNFLAAEHSNVIWNKDVLLRSVY